MGDMWDFSSLFFTSIEYKLYQQSVVQTQSKPEALHSA